jgi:hypothetical protein
MSATQLAIKHHSSNIAHTTELVRNGGACLTPPPLRIQILQQCSLLQHTTHQTLQYFRPSHLDQLHPREVHLCLLLHLGSSNMKCPKWMGIRVTSNIRKDLHSLPSRSLRTTGSRKYSNPAIPASQAPLQPLIESNLALADSLLQVEARLNRQREQSQSRLLSLRALEQQHRTKLSETEDALQTFSPMALYQRLSASVQEQEQLVRGLEESWLDEGGMASDREIGEFVRRVKENKKTAFLRAERKRRWDEGRVGGWR